MKIQTINKEFALKHFERIVYLHNLIPFQHWTRDDLLMESDTSREYLFKWQISMAALIENEIIGICISFYNNTNSNNHLYIHRLCVAPEFRLHGIGRELCIESCKAFTRIVPKETCNNLLVQSPLDKYIQPHETVSGFYRKIGLDEKSIKKYSNKEDIVYSSRIDKFINH